jgi:subfamily B ATP-binding cassette protein MsbA
MNADFQILKRLYKDYTKKYIKKILLSVFFTLLLAASTSSVAYLLDPAIKELFINQSTTMLYIIPLAIVLAFAIKGCLFILQK